MERFEGNCLAKAYIDRIVEKYPRYVRDQLSIISKAQQRYSSEELERALGYCSERELFSANDFRDTLEYFRREEPVTAQAEEIKLPVKYSVVRAQVRSLCAYNATTAGGDTL